MIQQEIPAFVSGLRAVDHHKGFVVQGTSQIQKSGDLLLAGAGLADDHHRLPGCGNGGNAAVQRTQGAAEVVEAVVEQVLAFAFAVGTDTVLSAPQRDLGGAVVEQVKQVGADADLLRHHPEQAAPLVEIEFQRGVGGDLLDLAVENRQNLRSGFCGLAEGGAAGIVQNHDAFRIFPHDAAQEHVLQPQPPETGAHGNGGLEGAVEAFRTGSDQERVESQLLGVGIGHHVADDHAVTVLLQTGKDRGDLLSAVNGNDIQLILQQVAEGVGGLGDVGETHDGVAVGIVAGQLHGPQNIVNGSVDLHHGNIRDLADHAGSTAPGNDAVVGVLHAGLDNGYAFGQVAGEDIQVDIGEIFGFPLHGDPHAFVGRNAQNM